MAISISKLSNQDKQQVETAWEKHSKVSNPNWQVGGLYLCSVPAETEKGWITAQLQDYDIRGILDTVAWAYISEDGKYTEEKTPYFEKA